MTLLMAENFSVNPQTEAKAIIDHEILISCRIFLGLMHQCISVQCSNFVAVRSCPVRQ